MSFVPYEPTDDYKDMNVDTFFDHLMFAFQSVLGISLGTITTDFKVAVREVLSEIYPYLPKSSLRALLDNDLPDFPDLKVGVPVGMNQRIRHVLMVSDFSEAVIQRYLEQKIQVHKADFRRDSERVKKLFGTKKVPGYMSSILGSV